MNFLYTGQIKCDSKELSLKILDNLSKVFGYSSQNMFMDDPNCLGLNNGSHSEGVEINQGAFQIDPTDLNLEKNFSDIESLEIKEELIENSSISTTEKILNQFEIILKQEKAKGKLPIDPHTINLGNEKEYYVETERRFKEESIETVLEYANDVMDDQSEDVSMLQKESENTSDKPDHKKAIIINLRKRNAIIEKLERKENSGKKKVGQENHSKIIHSKNAKGSSTKKGSKEYICNECNTLFSQRYILVQHTNAVHLKLKPYECDYCKKTFSQVNNLGRHIKGIHLQIKPFACAICKKTFSQKAELNIHFKTVHLKTKPHKCDQCKLAFAQKIQLTGHIQAIHLGLKSFVCDQCEKAFSFHSSLDSHIKVVHLKIKPHECAKCKKTFSIESKLKHHELSCKHKEIKQYKCEDCVASFDSKGHLKQHINRVHLKINLPKAKNLVCSICQAIFGSKLLLEYHMNKIHLNVKPYKCTFCSSAFFVKGNLTTHQKINHPEVRK